jgi:hypothetical protein
LFNYLNACGAPGLTDFAKMNDVAGRVGCERIFQKLKRCWNFFHVESVYIRLGDVFQRKTFEFEPGPIFIVETEQEVFATPN